MNIIPASGHNLWVAHFQSEDITAGLERDHIAALIDTEPVIGWLVDDNGSPAPITPSGVVPPGVNRYLNPQAESATMAAFNVALDLRLLLDQHQANGST